MHWLSGTMGHGLFKNCKWPLFALLFCCFASAILGDNCAESLLLAHCSTRLIPYMFLVNALFLFMSSSILMSLIDRVDRGALFTALTFGHGAMLLLIKTALTFQTPLLYPFLFSYAYVTKILLFLIFWTLANDLVDSRRASTEFPFVASGGTLGAICVSFAVPWLMKVTSADNLLFIWSALSFALGLLFIPVRLSFGVSFKASSDKQKQMRRNLKSVADDLKLVKKDPLLWNMAIFYFLLFFVVINQQYAFYAQLKGRLASAGQLASFLGYFNGLSMFATFALQIMVAGPVIKKIGSTRSMLFLPALLCCIFVVLTYVSLIPAPQDQSGPLFWCVVLGMGLRMAFFDSFFSPNFQIFFSSLSHDVRGRGKLAMEGVVKPLAIVCASLWLLLAAARLPRGIAAAFLFYCAAGMIVQTFRIRKKYTESLARGLTGFKAKQLSKLFDFVDLAKEDNFLTTLSRILEKEEYEIKKYIIEILAEMNSKESIGILLDNIENCDAITRSTIISSLGALKKENLKEVFLRHLHDPDKRVSANSIIALAAYETIEITGELEVFLKDADNRVKANTVVALWSRWTAGERTKLMAIVLDMLDSKRNEESASALYAMGKIKTAEFLPALNAYMLKNMESLVSDTMIWRQYIHALAKIGGDRALELLLRLSDNVDKKKTGDLIRALGRLLRDDASLDAFVKLLQKETSIHRNIMLGAIHERGLNIGEKHDALLRETALSEIRSVYSEWISIHTLDSKAELRGIQLLRTALVEESIATQLQNAVYAAAFLDKSGQVRAAMPRLYHANRHMRARAFEILDNVGDIRVNRSILRLLDTSDAAIHGREGALSFKIRSKSLMEIIAEHLENHHAWLRECAAYAASSLHAATNDPRWERLVFQTGQTEQQGRYSWK
jgi:HEAT repeat protein